MFLILVSQVNKHTNNMQVTTLTNFFSHKFAGRKANLENLRKQISINDAAKVTSLQTHNRWELNSVASNDSAFYDASEANNLKSFKNEIKFNSLNENDIFDEKTTCSSRHDLKLELLWVIEDGFQIY